MKAWSLMLLFIACCVGAAEVSQKDGMIRLSSAGSSWQYPIDTSIPIQMFKIQQRISNGIPRQMIILKASESEFYSTSFWRYTELRRTNGNVAVKTPDIKVPPAPLKTNGPIPYP